MTTEEIERLARESGGVAYKNRHVVGTAFSFGPESLRRFVEAIAATATPQAGEPAAWANASSLAIAAVGRERGGPYDQHTWSEARTAYHTVPLYLHPAPTPKPTLAEQVQAATDERLALFYEVAAPTDTYQKV